MFKCCTFSSEVHGTKKIKSSSGTPLPRYQIIIESEIQVPSPRRSSSFSSSTMDPLKNVNQIQRWKYENGRFSLKHSGLIMEANSDKTGVMLWSKRPINGQSQQWAFVHGCIQHELTGLVLEATEDGHVFLAEKRFCCSSAAEAKIVLSSSPTSLPTSFASYGDLAKIPITSPSIDESSFTIDPAQKWRLSSKGYIVNKGTKKVLCPIDLKMGAKVVLKEKGQFSRNRSSSIK